MRMLEIFNSDVLYTNSTKLLKDNWAVSHWQNSLELGVWVWQVGTDSRESVLQGELLQPHHPNSLLPAHEHKMWEHLSKNPLVNYIVFLLVS